MGLAGMEQADWRSLKELKLAGFREGLNREGKDRGVEDDLHCLAWHLAGSQHHQMR